MKPLYCIIAYFALLPLVYVLVRLVGKAIFRSYFTEKRRRRKKNENEDR